MGSVGDIVVVFWFIHKNGNSLSWGKWDNGQAIPWGDNYVRQ